MRKHTVCSVVLLALLFPSTASSDSRHITLKLRSKPWTLPLQNEVADILGLERFETPEIIVQLAKEGWLIEARGGDGWHVEPDFDSGWYYPHLPHALRYVRPWVVDFLDTEGILFQRRFPAREMCGSGFSRTFEWQRQLARHNPNATRGETPDRRSGHLTGSAVDISKRYLSVQEIRYFRKRLDHLQECGVAITNEEWATNSFHVFVLPYYMTRKKDGSCDAPLRP